MVLTPKVSFEFFPPHSAEAETQLWKVMEKLVPLSPSFFSVTYGAGGSTRNRTERVVERIHSALPIPPAAHLTCIGATRKEIDNLAKNWWDAGIQHIVALRGDSPFDSPKFAPNPNGYENAAALVAGLRRVADFEISVAGYPEKHPDSPNVAADLDNLKRKIDAGATRILTQYFFDNSYFYRFRDAAAASGITAPLVPGILPITNFSKVLEFSKKCATIVPDRIAKQFRGLEDDSETRNLIAASIAIEQCEDLLKNGVCAFHFYTLNRAALTYAICWRLGMRPSLNSAADAA
ncbi:MAG: methylenetetrahydrofolate reductase [NAD(P)H] [Pseudomonadota bacterium]|nr:methylenetetrahydrofolate reductase [NAD(P)H] [Pseudomonadota bacterium]